MAPRQYGFANTDARDLHSALDPNSSLSLLVIQGGEALSDLQARQVISQRDHKHKVVVVACGDLNYCLHYQALADELSDDDVMLFVSDDDTLQRLGVPVIDAGYGRNDPKYQLESLISRVRIVPSKNWMGFWSKPRTSLDQTVFDGKHLKPEIRDYALDHLFAFWQDKYKDAPKWTRVFLCGSAASYQYAEPVGTHADIDILVGINVEMFKRANPQFADLTEDEIDMLMNKEFNLELEPQTKEYMGFYVTFFVNPDSWDIHNINPYAAYNITDDKWDVPPLELPADWDPFKYFDPKLIADSYKDVDAAHDIVDRYNQAKDRGDDAARVQAVQDATALFSRLYTGRQLAYRPGGHGYFDDGNFRWQLMEAEGALQPIWDIKNFGLHPTEQSIWLEDMTPAALFITHDPRKTKR